MVSIQPANVLVAQDSRSGLPVVKLADFGVSRLLDLQTRTSNEETPVQAALAMSATIDATAAEWLATSGAESSAGPGSQPEAARSPIEHQQDRLDDLASGRKVHSSGAMQKLRHSNSAQSLTQTGTLMGTPLYMAPELAQGSHLAQPPADVFSFGVMAYELLSKRLPFAEPPILLLLSPRIAEPPTPLAQLCPQLNALVASMLDRCLQIHPEDRPSSRELAEMLRPFAGTGTR